MHFASINSILINTTTLTLQRSHGTGFWESISNPKPCGVVVLGGGGVNRNMGHAWKVVAAFCSDGSPALDFVLTEAEQHQ